MKVFCTRGPLEDSKGRPLGTYASYLLITAVTDDPPRRYLQIPVSDEFIEDATDPTGYLAGLIRERLGDAPDLRGMIEAAIASFRRAGGLPGLGAP